METEQSLEVVELTADEEPTEPNMLTSFSLVSDGRFSWLPSIYPFSNRGPFNERRNTLNTYNLSQKNSFGVQSPAFAEETNEKGGAIDITSGNPSEIYYVASPISPG